MNSSNTAPCPENVATSKPVTVRLAPDDIAKTERYAKQDQRSRASFVRLMMLRGLAAYEKELAVIAH